jgi:hypothetical protein
VVPYLGGVVEDAAGGFLDDGFESGILELGALDQVVQVGHVGLMVLAIVVFEGFLGDVRRERIHRVGQRRKGVFHIESPVSVSRVEVTIPEHFSRVKFIWQ